MRSQTCHGQPEADPVCSSVATRVHSYKALFLRASLASGVCALVLLYQYQIVIALPSACLDLPSLHLFFAERVLFRASDCSGGSIGFKLDASFMRAHHSAVKWLAGKAFKGVPRERFAITSKCEPHTFKEAVYVVISLSVSMQGKIEAYFYKLSPCRWGPMMKGQQFLPLDLSPQACRAAVEESLRDLQVPLHTGALAHAHLTQEGKVPACMTAARLSAWLSQLERTRTEHCRC